MAPLHNHHIAALHITDRFTEVEKVQKILTEFGTIIKTRIGLHNVTEESDNPGGILILELLDKQEQLAQLKQQLQSVGGVEYREIVFEH